MDKILIVDDVTKEYPGRVAVRNVSFEVAKGSIHGFLGPNGAGKSTTMKMIAGLMQPTSGSMTLFGEKIDPENKKLKNLLGLLPENAPLHLDMTVEKYLMLVAALHGLKSQRESVERVMEELSLISVKERLIGNLSKGFKQRVGLAQAIVYDAPFLILDEPTNGLDPESVVELREFIRKLAQNKTILFSSHVLSEVELLCDHITIIHQGLIRASGSLHDIHRKFRQGLTLKIGLKGEEKLPLINQFGKHHISEGMIQGGEIVYTVSFEDDLDCRAELSQYLVKNGAHLMTMQVESPELEDIFLHMTEKKK